MECVFLWMCALCLPSAIVSAALTFVTAALTSPRPHGRGLLWGSAAVTALGAGSSCSAHLRHLPALTPLLLLVSSASHFPSKNACFEWQKGGPREGCLQHWLRGEIEGKCIAGLGVGKMVLPGKFIFPWNNCQLSLFHFCCIPDISSHISWVLSSWNVQFDLA